MMNEQAEPNRQENILKANSVEKYHTVNELLEEAKPNSLYFVPLVISAFIIAGGLLLNNAPIIIGGMLVTPVLTPVLALALGVSTGEIGTMRSSAWLIVKSALIVIGSALVLAFLFNAPDEVFGFDNSSRTSILYFIVALGSGMAATFAWIRKEMSSLLPGVAVSVSLVPPLSAMGIWLAYFDAELLRFYFAIFFFNLVGIIIGSALVFSLLKFYKVEKLIEKKTEEIKHEQELQHAEAKRAKEAGEPV